MAKIFYRLTKEQEAECQEFLKTKNITIPTSDFILDGFKTLVMNTIQNTNGLLETKQITQKELDDEQVQFTESIPEGNGEKRVIVLSGEKIVNGLIQACKLSNVMDRKSQKKTFSTLEPYLQEYIEGQMKFIHMHLMELEINKELEVSKKQTVEHEIAEVRKNFKAKVTESK